MLPITVISVSFVTFLASLFQIGDLKKKKKKSIEVRSTRSDSLPVHLMIAAS